MKFIKAFTIYFDQKEGFKPCVNANSVFVNLDKITQIFPTDVEGFKNCYNLITENDRTLVQSDDINIFLINKGPQGISKLARKYKIAFDALEGIAQIRPTIQNTTRGGISNWSYAMGALKEIKDIDTPALAESSK